MRAPALRHVLIDAREGPPAVRRARARLAGTYRVTMEYVERTQTARAFLHWEPYEELPRVGNIRACVPPNPPAYAWLKVYAWDGDREDWTSLDPRTETRWRDIMPSGYPNFTGPAWTRIDGLDADPDRYGAAGRPYLVEQYYDDCRAPSSDAWDPKNRALVRVRGGRDSDAPDSWCVWSEECPGW